MSIILCRCECLDRGLPSFRGCDQELPSFQGCDQELPSFQWRDRDGRTKKIQSQQRTNYDFSFCDFFLIFSILLTFLIPYPFPCSSQRQWGITQLYNQFFDEPASQLYKLHATIDRLVLQAYGFNATDDLLAKLLDLNLELTAREAQGEAIVGP